MLDHSDPRPHGLHNYRYCFYRILFPSYRDIASILQALQDYDRRTRLDRNQQGHKYAEEMLRQALSGTPLGATAQCPTGEGQGGEDGDKGHKEAVPLPPSPPLATLESAHGPDEEEEEPPEAGEVVAVVRGNSTAADPKITFGRVLKVVDREYAIICAFEEVSKDTFAFKIGAKERVRVKEIVTPIDMVYQPTTNTYSLRTLKTDIHSSRRPL